MVAEEVACLVMLGGMHGDEMLDGHKEEVELWTVVDDWMIL